MNEKTEDVQPCTLSVTRKDRICWSQRRWSPSHRVEMNTGTWGRLEGAYFRVARWTRQIGRLRLAADLGRDHWCLNRSTFDASIYSVDSYIRNYQVSIANLILTEINKKTFSNSQDFLIFSRQNICIDARSHLRIHEVKIKFFGRFINNNKFYSKMTFCLAN